MKKFDKQIREIVAKYGGFREKEIMSKSHDYLKSGTWNDEHKVIYILENNPKPDGYCNGFAVDIVTNSICG